MVSVQLTNLGKKYRYEWIFKKIDYQFHSNQSYALLGGNGSGKSTLLRIISASLSPSFGKINYIIGKRNIEPENVYKYISNSSPALELIEEFTLKELLLFQAQFKPFLPDFSIEKLLDITQLPKQATDKQVRYFSSGMKQRLKLTLAILADVPILLLDEPTTNLDTKGIDWYRQLIQDFAQKKLLIIASNQKHEYDFCQHNFNVEKYKS